MDIKTYWEIEENINTIPLDKEKIKELDEILCVIKNELSTEEFEQSTIGYSRKIQRFVTIINDECYILHQNALMRILKSFSDDDYVLEDTLIQMLINKHPFKNRVAKLLGVTKVHPNKLTKPLQRILERCIILQAQQTLHPVMQDKYVPVLKTNHGEYLINMKSPLLPIAFDSKTNAEEWNKLQNLSAGAKYVLITNERKYAFKITAKLSRVITPSEALKMQALFTNEIEMIVAKQGKTTTFNISYTIPKAAANELNAITISIKTDCEPSKEIFDIISMNIKQLHKTSDFIRRFRALTALEDEPANFIKHQAYLVEDVTPWEQ